MQQPQQQHPQPPQQPLQQSQVPQQPSPPPAALFPLPLQLGQPAPAFYATMQQPPLAIPMPSSSLLPLPMQPAAPPPSLLPFLHPPPPPLPPLPPALPSIISDPSDWQAHNEAGMVMHRNGLLEQAVEHLTLAVQYAPEGSVARRNLAMVKVDIGTRFKLSGAVADAVRCYEEALQVLTSFAPAYFNLAVIFSERGQYEQALKYYQLAVRYNPNYVEALCIHEDTLVKVRRRAAARGARRDWVDVKVQDVALDDVLMDERGRETAIIPPIVPLPDQPLYRVECFADGSLDADDADTALVPVATYDVSDRHLVTVLCRSPPTFHRSAHSLDLLFYRVRDGRAYQERLSADCSASNKEESIRHELWRQWEGRKCDDACVQGALYDVLVDDLHQHLHSHSAAQFRRHLSGVRIRFVSSSSSTSHSHCALSSSSPPLFAAPHFEPVDLLITRLPHRGTVIALSVSSPDHRYVLSSMVPTHNWSAARTRRTAAHPSRYALTALSPVSDHQ